MHEFANALQLVALSHQTPRGGLLLKLQDLQVQRSSLHVKWPAHTCTPLQWPRAIEAARPGAVAGDGAKATQKEEKLPNFVHLKARQPVLIPRVISECWFDL